MREDTECLRTILSQDPFIEARTTTRESLAIKRFSDLCSTFGDHDEEIANAILVDEKNKKHFLMLAAGCMTSLGYAGECEKRMQREHWDLRNKAATEYCLEHLETLMQMFSDITGTPLAFRANAEHQYFDYDCLLMRGKSSCMRIAMEIQEFEREHPTLQQKMVGMFLRIIARNHLYVGITETGFPFI